MKASSSQGSTSSSPTQADQDAHAELMDIVGRTFFRCYECDKTFATYQALSVHLKTHSDAMDPDLSLRRRYHVRHPLSRLPRPSQPPAAPPVPEISESPLLDLLGIVGTTVVSDPIHTAKGSEIVDAIMSDHGISEESKPVIDFFAMNQENSNEVLPDVEINLEGTFDQDAMDVDIDFTELLNAMLEDKDLEVLGGNAGEDEGLDLDLHL